MAFYQGKLYAIAADENLLVVDISQDPSTGDPQVSRIGQVIKGDPWYAAFLPDGTMRDKKLYLVKSNGALMMIRRKACCSCRIAGGKYVAGQNEFEVFKADIEHSRWVSVTTFGGDQMVFLGRRCSRVVSASQYGMPGDHIFFLDDDVENVAKYHYEEESTSVGVYNMRNGEVSSPLPMIWKHEMIITAWLFPLGGVRFPFEE